MWKIAFFRQIDTITWFVKNDTTNSVDAIKNSIIRNKLSVSINTNHNCFRNLTEFMHYRLRPLRNTTSPSYIFLGPKLLRSRTSGHGISMAIPRAEVWNSEFHCPFWLTYLPKKSQKGIWKLELWTPTLRISIDRSLGP